MPAQSKLPIITDGIHGDVPINFYPASDSELGVILQPTPGLLEFCSFTDCTEVRGAITFSYTDGSTTYTYMYFVAQLGSQSVLWRVDSGGGTSKIGTITTSASGPVYMVGSTSQLLICDGVSGYVYTPSTGLFVQITDSAFPGASSCDSQDGYGLFTTPGTSREWFISNLYDFTSFNANQFYVKEGKPDPTITVKSLLREPWIFGTLSIEVWTNVGGYGTSPTFARLSGGLLEYGCNSAASVVPVNSKMMWLTDKSQLVQAIAYQPNKISTQMMERALGKMSKTSDAVAFTYTDQKHDFYVLSLPAGNQTWVWDDTVQALHKRQSLLDDGSGYGRHRANCYTLFNDKHYVGDYSNGKVYEMSTDYYDDDGEEIRREFYMAPLDMRRVWTNFPPVEIGVKSGIGLISWAGTGRVPQIMLSFSEDQGETWSNEVWRSAGAIGEYGTKAVWSDTGSGYWRMYKAVMTDPVFWQIQTVNHGA